jgi:hypothetical protein
MKKIVPVLFIALIVAGLMILLSSCNEKGADLSPQTGAGGSMARFAITGNTLYIVSRQSLEVYDISNGANPDKKVTKNLSVGIETIFPYQDNLFIGSTNGMYVFDNRNPLDPLMQSQYTHVLSCDPVVAQGKYAYVTLRGGVACRPGGGLSSLDVVDLTNPKNLKLVDSQVMKSPYGLGVQGNKLFVCEGDNGLKLFDLTNPVKPVLSKEFKDIPSYDVIALEDHLILTGKDGLFQFEFDDKDKFGLLSKISVQ